MRWWPFRRRGRVLAVKWDLRTRPELMSFLAIYGCAGGDMLVDAKASGALTPCSFAVPEPGVKVDGVGERCGDLQAFSAFRRWKEAAEEPCRSCEYLALCRGGCRVVSGHLLGDLTAPDPECPKGVDYRATHGPRAGSRSGSLPVVA
jgi:radical SAM protein with 4Fe4S-binding SPASM domain